MPLVTRPDPETHRWARRARSLLPAALAIALVGMLGWVLLGPDEDPTAKALAARVARESCGHPGDLFSGSTVIEEDVIPAPREPAARIAARNAADVAYITCKDGFADAGTYLLGYASSADLDVAVAAVARSPRAGRLCLLDGDLFTPGFGPSGAFATTCSALGGIELGGEPAIPDVGDPTEH